MENPFDKFPDPRDHGAWQTGKHTEWRETWEQELTKAWNLSKAVKTWWLMFNQCIDSEAAKKELEKILWGKDGRKGGE